MSVVSPDLAEVAFAAIRVVLWAGYVMLAGTLALWVLVWPEGRYDRRQLLLVDSGLVVLSLGTVLVPVVAILTQPESRFEVLPRESWVAVLVRLAILVATWAFLTELVDAPIRGVRRLVAATVVVALTATMVLGSDAIAMEPLWASVLLSFSHLLAMATWLAGLAALASVILPRQQVMDVDELIPALSKVALTCIGTLVVTGAIMAVLHAGDVASLVLSAYGGVLLVKVGIFVGMLVLASSVRLYTDDLIMRRLHVDLPSAGLHALAVLMGAQLATVAALLVTTAVLVAVAPL